jgi:peptide chain release factor 2
MLGGIFDINQKKLDLEELNLEMSIPSFWDNQVKAIQKSKEQESLNSEISKLENIKDSIELLLSEEGEHQDILDEVIKELNEIEFQKMFSSETDFLNCYIDIQAGSGGTESNDWAQMLLRMYTRWLSQKGFDTELLDYTKSDVAGIKSATLKVTGKLAYGWCKFESGVHRLVRKSPFDSNNKRHTSFAAVFVYPEVDNSINIEINKSDVREDTFRASGAGGQHINKTDSAIRLTHIPTGIVVTCQSERSQHSNRASAWDQLKSKLYQLELQKQNEVKSEIEDSKLENGWGSQIRSYVLDDSRVKDLRTGYESKNPSAVLDGDLDPFVIEMLQKEINYASKPWKSDESTCY